MILLVSSRGYYIYPRATRRSPCPTGVNYGFNLMPITASAAISAFTFPIILLSRLYRYTLLIGLTQILGTTQSLRGTQITLTVSSLLALKIFFTY